MKRLSIGLLFICLILLGLGYRAPLARAQGSFSQDFDFTVSDGGWTLDTAGGASPGSYVGGVGWQSVCFTGSDGAHYNYVSILYTPTTSFEFTGITVTFNRTFGTNYTALSDIVYHDNSSPPNRVYYQAPPTGSGTGQTLSWSGSVTAASLGVLLSTAFTDMSGSCATMTGSVTITHITVTGNGSSPFPTNTPTPTNTPPPTSTPGPTPTIWAPPTYAASSSIADNCKLIPHSDSTFTNLLRGGWNTVPSTIRNPFGYNKWLELPAPGSATLTLHLEPANQYQIRASFRTTSGTATSFTIGLGETTHTINIASGTALQTWTGPAQNYRANTGGEYELAVSKAAESPDPGIIVESVCVELWNTDGAGNGAGIITVECRDCTYRPQGDLIQDFLGLIGWLWCNLSNLWTCVIKGILLGLWQTVVNIITFISFLRLWASRIIENAINWTLGNISVLWAWLGGNINNLITSLLNLALNILNSLGLTGIVNSVLAFILSLPEQIASAIGTAGQIASLIWQIAATVISIVITVGGQVLSAMITILGVVPELIASVAAGVNNSSAVPAYAPNCNDSNSLFFAPCLGMYIADNTIFSGPAYYLVPMTMGFVGFQTLMWAMHQIRDALDKS